MPIFAGESPLREGVIAFLEGKKLKDNPYPDDLLVHRRWRRGWMLANRTPKEVSK